MPRDWRGDFGVYVGIHRELAGLSQTQLSAAVPRGPSQSEISNWETGKDIPSDEAEVRAIARKINVAETVLVQIWRYDRADRDKKGAPIVTRAYRTTSEGGGTPEDPYA